MTDYKKYINALRKCAKEHENGRTSTGHIIVSDLCRDTANLLEKLEQEPTTKNDLGVDCISREAVERIINKWLSHPDYELKDHIYSMTEKIHNLSPATPQEPKTGHWIANAPQYSMLNPQYICSECGNAHTRTTPYCEMCGAKMVEPQESEDT